jgi:hypothetical protein
MTFENVLQDWCHVYQRVTAVIERSVSTEYVLYRCVLYRIKSHRSHEMLRQHKFKLKS